MRPPHPRPLSLRARVLDQLRTEIITGELAEGTLVSAPTLGRAMGVSATPVREAMMDLAREGLVETVRNKGFRITRMSGKDLDDLTQIRLLLEPPVLRLVAGELPADVHRELLGHADACLRAAKSEQFGDYLREDREFHAGILALTGNAQLVDLVISLRLRTRLYGIRPLSASGRLIAQAEEHYELLRLLGAGEGEAAESLLHAHIGHAREFWASEAH